MIIDSSKMALFLTKDRIQKTVGLASRMAHWQHCSVSILAQLLGLLVANMDALQWGHLHLCPLQWFLKPYQPLITARSTVVLPVNIQGLFESLLVDLQIEFVSGQDLPCALRAGDVHGCKPLEMGSNASQKTGSGQVVQPREYPTNQHIGAQSNTIGSSSFQKTSDVSTCTGTYRHCGQGPHQPSGWVKVIGTSQRGMQTTQMGGTLSGLSLSRTHKRDIKYPSRLVELGDHQPRRMDPEVEVFQLIVNRFSLLSVDLFMTHQNRQVHSFFSRYYHQEAEAIDALSLEWPPGLLYAFPQFQFCRMYCKASVGS